MPHAHLDARTTIRASAHAVFERMSDLSRFNDWNPFPSMDPTTVSRHEGPASGVGAVCQHRPESDPPHRPETDPPGVHATLHRSVDLSPQKALARAFWGRRALSPRPCACAGETNRLWS